MAREEPANCRAELEQTLKSSSVGYLGVVRDGSPYVVPLNYVYDDGEIIFHCSHNGWKLDGIHQNPDVCFCVGWQTGAVEPHEGHGECAMDSESATCFGTARIIEDEGERAVYLNRFLRAYVPDGAEISEKDVKRCACVVIAVREITGRRERDRKRSHSRCVF